MRQSSSRSGSRASGAAYWRAISYQAQGKHSQARKEFELLYAEALNFRDVAQRLADFSVR